jgi:surface polysaccharide O-acyltransferase-like enzyme
MGKKTTSNITTYDPKRLLWADGIRIIAIYLVVTLHISSFPLDRVSVPLFVMLSGALLLPKKENYKIFFRKRGMKLIIPWVFWTLVYMIYLLYFFFDHQAVQVEYFNGNLANTTIGQWVYYFGKMFFTALWFLPLIFSLYCLTPLLRTIIHNSGNFEKYYMLFFWFLLFSFFPYVTNSAFFPKYEPNFFYTAFQYSGYFLLGYMLISIKPTKKIILSLVFFLVLAGIFVKETEGFLHPWIVLSSMATFYLLFVLFAHIEEVLNKGVKKVIAIVSGASFGVYVIHAIVSGLIGVYISKMFGRTDRDFIFTFIIFSISVLIVLILQRIPILKYIVPK